MCFTYFPYKYEQAYNIRIPRSELEEIADDVLIFENINTKNKENYTFLIKKNKKIIYF